MKSFEGEAKTTFFPVWWLAAVYLTGSSVSIKAHGPNWKLKLMPNLIPKDVFCQFKSFLPHQCLFKGSVFLISLVWISYSSVQSRASNHLLLIGQMIGQQEFVTLGPPLIRGVGSKWHHQNQRAVFVWTEFWLHFCPLKRSEDIVPIFVKVIYETPWIISGGKI